MIRLLVICSILFRIAALSSQESQVYSSNNCYSILEILGEGAFSKVFKAKNLQGEELALKTYVHQHENYSLENDPEREFLIGQTLSHPNIIKSIDFFSTTSPDHGTSHYLVLQLFNGKTLGSIRKGDLPFQQGKQIIAKLINAATYAFSQGRFYTDWNEGNVLVSEDFDIMIVDLNSFYTMEEMICCFLNNKNLSEQEIFAVCLTFSTDFFIRIIQKCNLERRKKIELCAEFKKVAWNFTEDIEEDSPSSLQSYFDQLLCLLE